MRTRSLGNFTCTLLVGVVAACGSQADSLTPVDECAGDGYLYVLDELRLPKVAQSGALQNGPPMRQDQYAIDIDQQGGPDYQLTEILGAVASNATSFDLQATLSESLRGGNGLLLFKHNVDVVNARCNTLMVRPALRSAGSDVVPLVGVAAVRLPLSRDSQGQLETPLPTMQTGDPKVLRIRIGMHEGIFELPIYGVHFTLTTATEEKLEGEIHGVIPLRFVQDHFPAVMANELTWQIRMYPGDESVKKVISFFEKKDSPASQAKCRVAADCCALNVRTCRISKEEVATSRIVQQLLIGDIKAFDNGRFILGSGHAVGDLAADSISVALGFSARPTYQPLTLPCSASGWCPARGLPPGNSTYSRMNDVSASGETLWVSGEEGVLVEFDGLKWKRLPVSDWVNMVSISASGPASAWIAATDRLISYQDGAFSESPLSQVHIYRITARPNNEAWAVGEGGAFMHYQGGWRMLDNPAQTDAAFHDIAFDGAGNGWAVGQHSRVMRTTDGGATWTQLFDKVLTHTGTIFGVWLDTQGRPWLAAGSGQGLMWDGNHFRNVVPTDDPARAYVGVYGSSEGNVWFAANNGLKQGELFHTNDSGIAEKVEGLPPDINLSRVYMTSEYDIWAVGERAVSNNPSQPGTQQTSVILHCSTQNGAYDCIHNR